MKPSKAFKIILFSAAGLSLALVISVFCIFTLNNRASRKASNLCDSISYGEPISSVLAKAQRERAAVIFNSTDNEYMFVFNGFAFAHYSCRVQVNNQVVSMVSRVEVYD